MRKIYTIIFVTLILGMFTGCSYLKRAETRKQAARMNDIRVTFVTTQGEVNFFLYPEAAPITVANFINLGMRGFYNDNRVHRAVDGFIVQAGDPTETGQGGPGYTINDEIVEWLDFYQPGMLAMANAGPGTGGSQYFFTMYPADWLNGKHTVFGEIVSDADMNVIKKLEVGDVIREVKFKGQVEFFLSLHKREIEEWNRILDENYPGLRRYQIKDPEEFGDQVLQYREELERIYTPKEKEEDTRKEFFIPRAIRGIERRIKDRKAAKAAGAAALTDATILEAGSVAEPTQLPEIDETPVPVQLPEVEEAPQPEQMPEAVEEAPEAVEVQEAAPVVVEEAPEPAQLPEVEEAAEIVDSPDKVEVETIDNENLEGIDSLDDLDENKKSIWDRMKFWQKDEKAVKEIG